MKQEYDVKKKKFWKFWLLLSLLLFGFFAVFARLIYLQIIESDKYQEIARRQHQTRIDLSAERGNIYDRSGNLLASTIQSVSVAIDPNMLENKKQTCTLISECTGIEYSKLIKKINSASGSFVWIKRGMMPEKAQKLLELEDQGLILINEYGRTYYYGSIGAQLIGTTNIDNHGINGIELAWDSLLSGKSGYMIMYRDGLGRLRPSAGLPKIPAIDGYSVKLTIDIDLQSIVEYELKQGVLHSKAYSGTAVAIDPSSGEILAMASYPGYSPNTKKGRTSQTMRNRAITDLYEPGSTFKLVTAAAALEEGIVSENDSLNGYQGALHLNNVVIRDVHPLGVVPFREAVIHSSNIIFSGIANSMKDNVFYKYIRDFGFGITSGIDLPGEVPGTIQKPEDFEPTSKRFMGFGYGISATALQVLNAYAAVANNGIMMKPYVVESVYDNDDIEITKVTPERIRRVVSEKTAKRLTNLLTSVVDSGTGQRAKVKGMKIAGKTGTSQQLHKGRYSKQFYTASFAGFFPANEPKLALIIILDRPQRSYYGGSTAAPIFKDIALRWAALNHEFPDETLPYSDNKYIMPLLVGLDYSKTNDFSAKFNMKLKNEDAEGLIINQSPKPYDQFDYNTLLKLNTSPEKIEAKELKEILIGLPVRRGVAILAYHGYSIKLHGQGNIRRVVFDEKEKSCRIFCY